MAVAPLTDSGEQEGVHGNVEESAEFLFGPAVFGFAEQSLDSPGQGAVAGEVDIADRDQAKAVESGRAAVGVEAGIVVIAAQVAHLVEVAGGGARGGLDESGLELIKGDGGAGSQQGLT